MDIHLLGRNGCKGHLLDVLDYVYDSFVDNVDNFCG